MTNSVFVIVLSLVLARSAYSQDLFDRYRDSLEKGGERAKPRVSVDRSRLDLHLAPDFIPTVPPETSGVSKLGVNASFDYDFACGNFDIGAQFKHLLSKEVGEETLQTILGMLQSQLAKSSMVLLCETSPTLCQAFQHYRVSANALLKLNYDRCAAIEEAIDTVEKNLYTSALKECMREKQRAGMTIDEALATCRKSTKVRSLRGTQVAELDLTKEVADALGLTKDVRDLLGILGGETRYSSKGLESRIDSKAVERRYLAHRDGFVQAWERAIQKVASKEALGDEDLAALSPDGTRPVAHDELANVALLDVRERAILIASIASLAAKVKLDAEIREVERAFQVASMTPTADKSGVAALEQRVQWLRTERQRLEESYESQRALNDALLTVRAVGNAEMMKRVQRHYDDMRLRAAEDRLISTTRPFGQKISSVRAPERGKETGGVNAGDSCALGCIGGDWSWGKP